MAMFVKKSSNSEAQKLADLYHINQEIKNLTERIAALRYRAKFLSRKYTESECKEMLQEIKNLEEFLLERQKQSIEEQKKIEEFIKGIPSPSMRNIFGYRYINHLTWQQIAFKVGEYDESGVRKKHDNFLKEISNQKEGDYQKQNN